VLIFIFVNKLRTFLRYYLDKSRVSSNANHANQRIRISSDQFANEEQPTNAPEWTVKGYNGELQNAVSVACDK
jgi:hypothetical protein